MKSYAVQILCGSGEFTPTTKSGEWDGDDDDMSDTSTTSPSREIDEQREQGLASSVHRWRALVDKNQGGLPSFLFTSWS